MCRSACMYEYIPNREIEGCAVNKFCFINVQPCLFANTTRCTRHKCCVMCHFSVLLWPPIPQIPFLVWPGAVSWCGVHYRDCSPLSVCHNCIAMGFMTGRTIPLFYHHHHHHRISVMELGHLLTRSGLTYPEVSSKVYHDSFCQLGISISLPWVIYFDAFCLHVISSFSCIPVICPKLVLFLTPLQICAFVL